MEKIAEFRKLFECHFTPLVKYSYAITKDKEQSKDIVQNFFADIWKNGMIDRIESFESFAFHAIKNKSLTYLRSIKKFESLVPELSIDQDPGVHDQHFPGYLLEAAILGLPDKCREVFMLSKMDGLTYEEIADTLNVSVKTVEKHIHNGLQKIKEKLAPYKALFLESVK
ncbi:RNA polymerase sigma factor [Dawidia soli]|uniref:Sigma-70 family RNA polymerase sigma factor n=1 Tax=Dawidia soli TaxID=2782352 RepID=A0AAP2D7T4_9BACT|nr:sigma-70 family RNA polymerase sigma factor [Dawidia soli]MBT1686844.1 sigma-70 family RNA polymerase sigma factor [Dawidia soli]